MRKILLVIMMAFCIGAFCGCDSVAEAPEPEGQAGVPFAMESIGWCENGNIAVLYRNTTTDVLYIWSTSDAGFTEMSDPETGLPLTYERYKEIAGEEK